MAKKTPKNLDLSHSFDTQSIYRTLLFLRVVAILHEKRHSEI